MRIFDALIPFDGLRTGFGRFDRGGGTTTNLEKSELKVKNSFLSPFDVVLFGDPIRPWVLLAGTYSIEIRRN